MLSGIWVATAPESCQFCLFFVDLFARGGGRQRQLLQWYLIPLRTRAAIRWQMMWQGRRLGFVAETGRFVTVNDLSTISCFYCALLPTFLFSPACLIPVCLSSRSFVFLRLCSSSHLLLTALSASTYFMVRVLSFWCMSLNICILPHLGIPALFLVV